MKIGLVRKRHQHIQTVFGEDMQSGCDVFLFKSLAISSVLFYQSDTPHVFFLLRKHTKRLLKEIHIKRYTNTQSLFEWMLSFIRENVEWFSQIRSRNVRGAEIYTYNAMRIERIKFSCSWKQNVLQVRCEKKVYCKNGK